MTQADRPRRRVAPAFFALAVVLFIAIDLAAGVMAEVSVRGHAPAAAALEHLHYSIVQWAGTLFLSLPFLGLAWICLPIVRARGRLAAILALLCGSLALGGVSLFGYRMSSQALLDHQWTAAALDVAFSPFMALPVLLLAYVLRRLVLRARADSGTK
jgi:hypothetical protein